MPRPFARRCLSRPGLPVFGLGPAAAGEGFVKKLKYHQWIILERGGDLAPKGRRVVLVRQLLLALGQTRARGRPVEVGEDSDVIARE